MATALGTLESQFFAYAQMRRLEMVRSGELVDALDITPQQERELLSRLARRRLIARFAGACTLSRRACRPGEVEPEQPGGAGHARRRSQWPIPDLRPQRFLSLRLGRSDTQPALRLQQSHLRGAEDWFGGPDPHQAGRRQAGETEVVKTPDGIGAVYSSRVRSLVDAVYDWSRFDSLPRL